MRSANAARGAGDGKPVAECRGAAIKLQVLRCAQDDTALCGALVRTGRMKDGLNCPFWQKEDITCTK